MLTFDLQPKSNEALVSLRNKDIYINFVLNFKQYTPSSGAARQKH